MEMLVGLCATWVAAAAVFTFAMARAAAVERSFEAERWSDLDLVG